MTPSKMGKTKNPLILFSFLVRIVLFLHFIDRIYLSKISLHHFNGFILIITPLMKINVSIQEIKFITRKFRLRTDGSRDTRYSWVLIKQLPRLIAERAIHHVIVMDGQRFGQNQRNFLLTC